MMNIFANNIGDFFKGFWENTGIAQFFVADGWKNLIMILVALLLLYLAIFKKAEPYLLIPMGVGMLLVNLPGVRDIIFKTEYVNAAGFAVEAPMKHVEYNGLLGIFYPNGNDVVDMAKIAEETEKHLHNVYQAVDDSQRSIVGKAACDLADVLGVEKIIVYTDTGRSPAVVSQIKPKTPIIVMTRNEKVYYQSALLYGVEPVRIADIIEDENLELKTREYMAQTGMKSAILLFGHAIDSIKVLNN